MATSQVGGLPLFNDTTATTVAESTATGIPLLTAGLVSVSNVTNTSDANKPVSTAQQTALDLKAPLASPTFSGTVTFPTGLTGMVHAQAGVATAVPGFGYPPVTGSYVDISNSVPSGNWAAAGQTALRLYVGLIYFPKDMTFTEIGFRVTTGVASALGRIGIWNVGTDGKPGTLFWQGSTTVDCSTSSTNASLTGQTIAVKGGTWYFIGEASDSAISTLNASGAYSMHGWPDYLSTTKQDSFYKTLGSLVLPDPFGTPTGANLGYRAVRLLVP